MPQVKHMRGKQQPTTKGGLRSAWDSVGYMTWVLYGRSASGKTTFWSTFPGPIMALICSGSTEPGELTSVDTPEMREKIDARIVTCTADVEQCIEEASEGNYATVVLDHATGLSDAILARDVLGLDYVPVQKGRPGKDGAVRIEGELTASRTQYGQRSLYIKKLLGDMMALPKTNLVIVAQEGDMETGDEGGDYDGIVAPTIASALSKSVNNFLLPAVNYIGQTFIRPKMKIVESKLTTGKEGKVRTTQQRDKGVEYCLRTGEHDVFYTKFRRPCDQVRKGTVALPEVIVNPTYDKIKAIIAGKYKEY